MQNLTATADVDALIEHATRLLVAGRATAAAPLIAAARRLAPASEQVLELGAQLALRSAEPARGCAELDAAVAAAPAHAGLRKCRAELRWRLGNLDGAARDAAEAVVLDRADPVAKALLGVLMLELGRAADAEACLAEAVAAEPANPAFREGLAAAQEATGEPETALDTLRAGIAAAPHLVQPRNAAILLCMRQRDFRQAVRLAEEARIAGIADACLFGMKGHALSSLGRHAEAAEAYAEALKLGPEDPYVRHLVAAAGIRPGADRAPAEYLRTVFDGYADRFEQHLVSLGYRIPGIIRTVLAQHPDVAAGRRVGPVLDLGCGTGLVALAIADLPVGPITGIDIAPRMLAAAAQKQLYADLREADVLSVLGQPHERWPLILAADVLVYFGALEEFFARACTSLTPGGWLVASVEELLPDADGIVPGNGDWALQLQGRFAHAPGYLQRAASAAGLRLRQMHNVIVRQEADAPVAGLLFVLERPGYDG